MFFVGRFVLFWRILYWRFRSIVPASSPISEFQLPKVLVENLSHSGVDKLFPVQAHVVPYLLSSLHGLLRTRPGGSAPSDVCVCAPTGCGKTLCYVLPVIAALINRVVKQVWNKT